MPDLPFELAFDRQPDLVLQDDRVNTVPALHTAESFDIVVARILQVVTPLAHEQALTTDTGSRRKLLASWKRLNGISSSGMFPHSAALWLCSLHYPFHDSVSSLLVRREGLVAFEYFPC